MKKILERLVEISQEKLPCVLATIIRQAGPSPRGAGAKFIIMKDGTFEGTIGGGPIEAKALAEAKRVFISGRPVRLDFHLDGTDVEATEMLCGGEVEVLLEPLDPDGAHVSVIKRALETIGKGGSGILFTAFDRSLFKIGETSKLFIDKAGEKTGFRLPEASEAYLLGNMPTLLKSKKAKIVSAPFESGRQLDLFAEPVKGRPHLLILGAGHVSRQIAPLAERVGFKVFVMDDRPEFADRRYFGKETEVRLVSYSDALEGLNVSEDSFVVIVTRGHLGDKTVLAQALQTEAGYIGMIGSTKKREAIFHKLIEEGFSKKDLKKVYCPIGVEIGADSPEEIAVSIVAELIKVRAGLGKDAKI